MIAVAKCTAHTVPGSFSILAFTVISEMVHTVLRVWYRKAEYSSTELRSTCTGSSNVYERVPSASDTVLTFSIPSVDELQHMVPV